jgi:hypothetical protein
MTDLIWVLRGLEGSVLVLGAGIAYASLRAYARTGRASLGLLGLGFVLVTVAAALSGILFEFVTHDLLTAWSVSAAFDGAGFAVILYSIVRPATIAAPTTASVIGQPPER